MSRPDILFTNACHISNDRHEQITMRPYPALGPLYIAAYLREHGYGVEFFDSVFQTDEQGLAARAQELDPPDCMPRPSSTSMPSSAWPAAASIRKVPADVARLLYYRMLAALARHDRVRRTLPPACPGFSHNG